MKKLLPMLFIVTLSYVAAGQQKTVTLRLCDFNSKNKHVDATTANEAVRIANIVLNSREFRDSVSNYDFRCENYGEPCSGPRIKGSVVLDSVYRRSHFDLDLFMKNCGHEYGHSEQNRHYIQSCYKTLRKDDNKLPFSYIYAYHICHEYLHIVGYYHTDHKDDVAEKIGWIGYYILDRWFTEGRRL